jgi:hypothetical protein
MVNLYDPATNKPHIPTTKSILNTADPTIEPIPALDSLTNTLIREMKTSGAELPAAIKVAPATS